MDQFDVEKLKDGAEIVLKEGKNAWDKLNSFTNFDNPGRKLKSFVKVLNKINLALTIILFVVWFFYGMFSGILQYLIWVYLLGFVGILLLYALSYLSCLFLYAFAEMVDNSTSLVELKKKNN